jgi:predicted DNA-binding protein
MNTPQAQIKVNLPLQMKAYLESKASKFGMPLAGYIKHLILKDIEDMDYPTYEASDSTEEAYKKATEESKTGKTIKVDNLDKFFDEL